MAGESLEVAFQLLNERAQTPQRMSEGASGYDVFASLESPVVLEPLTRLSIQTGVSLAIPPGYEAQVRPRSGLAWKQGITVLNAPGTIDSDYRGEVQVLLMNLSQEPVTISPRDRIAQLVFMPTIRVSFRQMSLDDTKRGQGGFGSTGGIQVEASKSE